MQAAPDMVTWTTLTGTQAAAADAIETAYVDSAAAKTYQKRFYEVTRTALASYDPSPCRELPASPPPAAIPARESRSPSN